MNPKNDKVDNEKMLETIFNNTHFLMVYMDNNFNFIKVNRAYAEKHNKNPEFFVGKNLFELYPNGNKSVFKNVLETGKPYFAYSKPLDHPVLGISYWDWAIQPLKDENGEINTILLSLTDVTEYKRNEEEIQKEQRNFIDELIEKRANEILREREEVQTELDEKRKLELTELNQKIIKLEKINENLKKELESQNAEEDEYLQVEAFDKQITELKKANEDFKEIIDTQNPKIEELYQQVIELRKSRDDLEDILSSKLSEIKDLNQRITDLENDASEKGEIISQKELEIEKLNHEIIELEKKDSESLKLISTKDSEIEEINKNIDALRNALNDSKEAISIKELDIKKLNDEISELKMLKEDSAEIISAEMQQIQELNEKISEKQQIINELTKRNEILRSELENKVNDEELLKQLDELIKANEELEKFVENAANELQEPLRAIKSFNNILAKRYRGKIDKDTDEFIDYALEAVARLNKKIIDLLEYSRIESRGKEFKLTETEEILDYAMSNLNASLEGNKAKITRDNLPKIMADSGQILQLFQNLLNNAVRFKNPDKNPQIHISSYLDDKNKEYVFSIQDNGIGIEEKDQKKIFEIFKRLNPENGYEGTGIGLSISKKIVERHGGRIWVESEPGIGSKFYFTIPTQP